jgi:galactokinase/mevalonate kinase-like predicted kinase
MSALTTDIEKIAMALKYASQIDFGKAAQAFQSADLAGEIATIDDVLRVIGVFVPPVAIAADDLAAALGGFELLMQFANGKIPQVTLDLERTIEDRFE